MKKSDTTFICFFGLLIGQVNAQCDLVITSLSVFEDCWITPQPYTNVHWTGGAGPYTITVVPGYGTPVQMTVSGNNWSGGLQFFSDITYDATFTITDALGCEAVLYTSWLNHFPVEPELTLTGDCVLGAILRWTGKFYIGFGSEYFSTCGSVYYSIYGSASNSEIQSGDLHTDWVQEAGTTWRYPGSLPAGNYWIYIGANGGECNQGTQVICFNEKYISIPSNPSNCGANLQLRASLSGAYQSGTLMNDQLRSSNILPTTEPYSALGYAYTGSTAGATILPSVLAVTGNNAIVDWVIVELRSASNPATILYARPALIKRDGDVVGLNGSTTLYTSLAAGNYHVAIRHRNHLGVMTASSVALSSTPATIDFTNLATATYGTNAQQNINGTMAFWPGDANFDGTAIYTGTNNDRDLILTAIGGTTPTNTVINTYSPLDINMDGVIRYTGTNNDRDIILQSIGGVVPTATRNQQLP